MKIQEFFTIPILIFSFSFNSTAQNYVTFSKSLQDKFSFYVMETNSGGICSERIASLSFVFQQHFWQMWWFIPVLVVVFILLALPVHMIILKSKIRKVTKSIRLQEEKSEGIRKMTTADFYDEVGHRLTRISLLTELVKRKLGISFVELRPLLDHISENSVKLYEESHDFIWAIDSNKNTLYEVMIRLKDFGDETFSNLNINFNCEGISDELQKVQLTTNWKRDLIMIFKEGMSNSLKHSEGSKVSLTSNVKGNEYELILEDDGKGFEANENIKGNGLKNIKRWAADLNADIQIDTQPGAGTKLSLKGIFLVK